MKLPGRQVVVVVVVVALAFGCTANPPGIEVDAGVGEMVDAGGSADALVAVDASAAPSCLGDVWPIRAQDIGGWRVVGPPKVMQVFVHERVGGEVMNGLAFGDHPAIPIDPESPAYDDRVVAAAIADPSQEITVVLSEPIAGNHLESVACADGTSSRVPLGTTAEDVARCAAGDLSECTAVCVGVGVLDLDDNGVADAFALADYGGGELAVEVVCDETVVSLDIWSSEYRIQGSQQIEQLGPALALRPAVELPRGSRCTLVFHPEVVDCDGDRVCAPPGGDVDADCPAPGDTSLIQFDVEP